MESRSPPLSEDSAGARMGGIATRTLAWREGPFSEHAARRTSAKARDREEPLVTAMHLV
jgi:hypothetical protein